MSDVTKIRMFPIRQDETSDRLSATQACIL